MQDVIEIAKELISRPSITPLDSGCQVFIAQQLSALGFTIEPMRFGEVDNLWARYGQGAPLLVFAGHTDVVPTGPLDDWQTPPFQPTIQDGYLYGRGVSDMKGGIAAMLAAVTQFIKAHPQFPGSIAFLITSDEEGIALNGTKKVVKALTERGEKMDYCIVGEPSSDTRVGDQIRVGRRGSLHGKLMIHGKQGHVAHPHLAKNPIHLASLALHELAQTEWDQGNADFPPTTMQITNIHSGTGAANVIPGHLAVLFNFRFGTAITVPELKARTQAIFDQRKLSYDIEWSIGAEPFLTTPGALIAATQLAIKSVTQLDVKLSTGGGTSDGRFIAPLGVQVVELGVSHKTAHQVNECVRTEDLVLLTDIYYAILKQLLLAL